MTSGTVTPLADLPAGFFHALIVSRFDALEPPEQMVLKAGTGKWFLGLVHMENSAPQ